MIRFTCSGHKNILGSHSRTLEFTKDSWLTPDGNCIIGINADFDRAGLKNLLAYGSMRIYLSAEGISDTITADVNPDFDIDDEIVVRLGEFRSQRTLGVNSDKASTHVDRRLIEKMKNPEQRMIVEIEGFNKS